MAGHAAGGDVQFFGRHASTAFEFFPATGGTMFAQIDNNTTAQETGLLLRTDGSLKRVTVGAADSGGAGYRLLRVAN